MPGYQPISVFATACFVFAGSMKPQTGLSPKSGLWSLSVIQFPVAVAVVVLRVAAVRSPVAEIQSDFEFAAFASLDFA